MKATSKKFKTIDEYHSAFPENIKSSLEKLRMAIKQAAPQAEEVISYNMPAFKLKGMLAYYAAYKNHIGFYPGAVVDVFKADLIAYKTSKGTIQFPIDKALPIGLIKTIVKYKANENLEKAKKKEKKKKLL